MSPVLQPPEKRSIFGVKVLAVSQRDALTHIHKKLAMRQHTKYAYLNVHGANIAYKDEIYQKILAQFDVLCDGIGMDIASKILYGSNFPDNLNGTDFTPALLKSLSEKKSVALLGAQPGIAERAAHTLQADFPVHDFRVIHHGFFDDTQAQNILNTLKTNRPDILLVAMGNPAQEKWIATHCTGEHCHAAFGVGALFDFLAGNVSRAPRWVRTIRMEWVYRLLQEPGRMWRRYIVGNPLFLGRVLKEKFFQR